MPLNKGLAARGMKFLVSHGETREVGQTLYPGWVPVGMLAGLVHGLIPPASRSDVAACAAYATGSSLPRARRMHTSSCLLSTLPSLLSMAPSLFSMAPSLFSMTPSLLSMVRAWISSSTAKIFIAYRCYCNIGA